MKRINPQEISEILARFKRPGPGDSEKVEAIQILTEIESLKSKKFSGAICIYLGDKHKDSYRWLIFSEGELKLSYLEETDPYFSVEDIKKSGELPFKIFYFDDFQKENLRLALEEAPSVPVSQVFNREEILRKYRLKEPTEEYIDSILKGYREPTAEEREKCEKMIISIKNDLAEMFGEKMAEKMFEKQFTMLGIDEHKMTAKDIGTLLDSLQNTILKKLLGPKRAAQTIEKLKKKAFKIA
jgi:hypothetical protein